MAQRTLCRTQSIIELTRGQAALFGYGSLLSQRSMELTLARTYRGPRVHCDLVGWKRTWDVMMPNRSFFEATDDGEFVPRHIVYLNVTELETSAVNGILVAIEREELERFDEREWIYHRRNVTALLRGGRVEGGEAYVYEARPEWRLRNSRDRHWAAVRQTYLEIIEQGLTELGPDFRERYLASTDPTPSHLVFRDRKRGDTHPTLADRRV